MASKFAKKIQKRKDITDKKCTTHGDPIRFYCSDHNAICCGLCLHNCHKNCKYSANLLEAKDLVQDTDEVLLFGINLQSMIEKLNRLQTTVSENKEKCDEWKYNGLKEVRDFRSKIDKQMNDLQETVEYDIEKRHSEIFSRLENIEKQCWETKKQLVDFQIKFQDERKDNLYGRMFCSAMDGSKEIGRTNTYIQKAMNDAEVTKYEFVPDESLKKFISDGVRSFGALRDNVIGSDEDSERNVSF